MIIEPLNSIQSIQEAVKQDPSLRVSLAKKYQDLGGTLSNNAIPLPPETKEPLAIFSRDGKATVEEAKNKVAGFMPPEKPTPETPETPEKPTPTKGGLTFDEAVSLFGQDFTGIQQQPDGTYVPDKTALERLGITSAKSETETALEQSKIELEGIKKQLAGFMIPDAEVQQQISNISSQWDVRVDEMREINRRREAALMTTGLRLGSQYTGGLRGGVFGSIISEEERQAVGRISDLEAKKQEAILAAKQAQRENNYTVLVKQADLLEKAYSKQIDEIKEMNKLQADENKRLREETQKETVALQKDIDGIAEDAAKNGAPADLITAITSSKSRGEAIKAAGEYLKTGTGIIAEYNFYKKEAELKGQSPLSFDEYQTKDVNRKISIAKASQPVAGTELTTQQQAVFNRIIDKFNASEAIKAMDRASKLKDIISEIKKNPADPAQQLNLIYAYIKSLDTDSAVREGEIDLVRSINSYLGKFQLTFEKITSGKPITEKVALEIAKASETLINSIENTAKRKTAVFDAQAKENGSAVYGAWKGFRETMEKSQFNIGDDIIKSEQESEDTLRKYIENNPETKNEIDAKIKQMETSIGRSITSEEFLQAFPEYK